jgi:hypothetical protein
MILLINKPQEMTASLLWKTKGGYIINTDEFLMQKCLPQPQNNFNGCHSLFSLSENGFSIFKKTSKT